MSAKLSLEFIKKQTLEWGFEFKDPEYNGGRFNHTYLCLKHNEIHNISWYHLKIRKSLKCCGEEKLQNYINSKRITRERIEIECKNKNIELIYCEDYVSKKQKIKIKCKTHDVEIEISVEGLLKNKKLICCRTHGKVLKYNRNFINQNNHKNYSYSLEKVKDICKNTGTGFEFLDTEWKGSRGKYNIKCLIHDCEILVGWDTFTQSKKLICCHKANVPRGKDSPNYNHNLSDEQRYWIDRCSWPQLQWATKVKRKNKYVCEICGYIASEKIKSNLHAHHLYSWQDNPDLRLDLNNSSCLCKNCHMKFHQRYGNGKNTKEQFEEFKNNIFKEQK